MEVLIGTKKKLKEYPDSILYMIWDGTTNRDDISKFINKKIVITCDQGCCGAIYNTDIEFNLGDYICKDKNDKIYIFKPKKFKSIYE